MQRSEEWPRWYFAYGSNMCGSIFAGRRGMRTLASRWGWLEGYRLCFDLPVGPGERGVANLEREPGARTGGVLHLLAPEALERLDRSEGVHVGVYRRIPVEVLAEGRERVAAFAYESSRRSPGRKPSARYMGLLLAGAREHALPEDWIRHLRGFALGRDERETATALRGDR